MNDLQSIKKRKNTDVEVHQKKERMEGMVEREGAVLGLPGEGMVMRS
jgi:hypothetical protein